MSSPAETYAAMCEVARHKIMAPWHVQIVQGVLAGCYVALGGLLAITFEAGFDETVSHTLGMLVGGAVFPMGLIAVVTTGANLFTGNCMYIVPPLLNGTLPRGRTIAFLVLSWFTNFAGCLFVDYVISYQGEWVQKDPVKTWMQGVAEGKVSHSWLTTFVRGLGANWLVCLAMWQAIAAKDGVSKVLGVWFPVFAFTALGFEHSIANMFYIVTGMQVGGNCTVVQFLVDNEVPVTLGNFVSGFFFLGVVAWMSYDKRFQGDGVSNGDVVRQISELTHAQKDVGNGRRDALLQGEP
jgi:formate/nitrite transporter